MSRGRKVTCCRWVVGRRATDSGKNYLADLVAGVKKAAADGATLDEVKTKVADQLAPKYEAGMSKYWTGRYRERIAVNIEHVHKKVVKPA